MLNKRYGGFDFLKKNLELFFGQDFQAEKLTTHGVQGDVGLQAAPVPQLHPKPQGLKMLKKIF